MSAQPQSQPRVSTQQQHLTSPVQASGFLPTTLLHEAHTTRTHGTCEQQPNAGSNSLRTVSLMAMALAPAKKRTACEAFPPAAGAAITEKFAAAQVHSRIVNVTSSAGATSHAATAAATQLTATAAAVAAAAVGPAASAPAAVAPAATASAASATAPAARRQFQEVGPPFTPSYPFSQQGDALSWEKPALVIRESMEVYISKELAEALSLTFVGRLSLQVEMDGIQQNQIPVSEVTLTSTVPNGSALRLTVGRKFRLLLKGTYHRGWRRFDDGTLLLVASVSDSRRMTVNECKVSEYFALLEGWVGAWRKMYCHGGER